MLKKIYQEQGVPAWLRPYVPLVYVADRLAAVGRRGARLGIP